MSRPKISIVIPSFNAAEFLDRALESVVRQDYDALELLVVDGGSTDETTAIVRRYSDRIAYFVSEPDKGQSHAINKGLARSTGDFVGWLNADDVLFPGALRAVADNADTNWIAGRCLYIDKCDQELGEFPRALPRGVNHWTPDAWLEYTCARWTGAAISPASFWSRRAFETVGFLDESLHYTMDSNYYARLLAKGFFPRFVDDVMVGFRRHEAQKSDSANSILFCWELVKMQRKLAPLVRNARQLRRLTSYRLWTAGSRLPRACAGRLAGNARRRPTRWRLALQGGGRKKRRISARTRADARLTGRRTND